MIDNSVQQVTLEPSTPVSPGRAVVGPAARMGTVLAPFVFVAVIGAVLLTRVPVLGFRTVIITGGSMEPAISTGSLLFTEREEPEALEVGDIITFRYAEGRTTITHRIAGVREEGGERLFTTKGDANQAADAEEISFAVGRAYRTVLEMPYAGFVLSFLGSPVGIGLVVGIPLLILGLLQASDMLRRDGDVDEVSTEDG